MLVQCSNCGSRLNLVFNTTSLKQPAFTCPRCQTLNRVSEEMVRAQQPQPQALVPQKTVCGWLIVNDDFTEPQTFNLYEGGNTVGRFTDNNPANILVKTSDKFLSRHHFSISIIKNQKQQFEYLLSDNGSANGTFLNGEKDRLQAGNEIFISDGDAIVAGRTRLVLKTMYHSEDRDEATKTVIGNDHTKTVII